jgi:DNA-binding NtrC family response regulator
VGTVGSELGPAVEIGAYRRGGAEPTEVVTDDAPLVERVPADEPGVVVFRPGMTIEEMERQAIAAALEEVNGNRRKAAELLGIGERTLYRKISKYDLEA